MLRLLLVPLFALGIALSTAGTAQAESDATEAESDPGLPLFRQALGEYRAALAELREICSQGEDPGITVTRRSGSRGTSACERGIKELRTFVREARSAAREVTQKHVEQRAARRAAEKAAERAEEERKEAAERAEEERKEAAERAKEARKEAAERAAEARRKAAKQAEDARRKAEHAAQAKPHDKAAKLRDQIAALESGLAVKIQRQKEAEAMARKYRDRAAASQGAEREKNLAKAAEFDRQARDWAGHAAEYAAKRDRLKAELRALGG